MKKTIFIFAIIVFVIFLFANRFSFLYAQKNAEIIESIIYASNNLVHSVYSNIFFISLNKKDVGFGFVAVGMFFLLYLYNFSEKKNYLKGIEHGSAEWASKSDIKRYIDRDFNKNMILTETEFMSLNTRKTFRNNNVLVIGSAGSGKTRFYVKPNLMQVHCSYVISDSKGLVLKETGKMLENEGYKIKIFNLIDMRKSSKYNFFAYIKSEQDIFKVINNIIKNTNSGNNKNAGDFWEKAEVAFLQAIFGYVFYECSDAEKNMITVMKLIMLAETREDDEDYKSPLDILFDELSSENPEHFACRQYNIFKLSSGKTAKGILISVGVRLSAFNIDVVRNLVSEDTIELDKIGDEKTALFIILPDTDTSFNFLAAVMYQQLFDILFYKADNEYHGELPFNVRCMLDEFANIGQIPNFDKYIATMRSRGISVNIILQNLAQLKTLYKDSWETITGNCDTFLFLGGKEQSTLKYISEMIGKTTIDYRYTNESKGQNSSYSINNQIIARDLITPDEVGRISGKECILSIRGEKPFLSKKYDIKKHKKYKLLKDYNPNNIYEINNQ